MVQHSPQEPSVTTALENGVYAITLNRPASLNAITPGLLSELVVALSDVSSHGDVRVVVISGAGRSFCAGFDLKVDQGTANEFELAAKVELLHDVTRSIRRAQVPVIASVRGHALGAGAELALCCDLIIASQGARIGFPEVDVNLSVTGGISTLLPLAVGLAKAKELVLLGDHLSAAQAKDLHLVNFLVDDDSLDEETQRLAMRLAGKPAFSMAVAKATLNGAAPGDLETAYAIESGYAIATQSSEDAGARRGDVQGSGLAQ
ncbi:enoyl-CoA hydratase/isomerase family protein [Aeromicrobium sp. CF4.19]|uniref:enoyl-CoA hydratase/isomerase family protein n=1 Tax=Aeromicrobium sp. CF4.19 TaxID=3373082 RepID=UPI003EE6A90E